MKWERQSDYWLRSADKHWSITKAKCPASPYANQEGIVYTLWYLPSRVISYHKSAQEAQQAALAEMACQA